MGMIFNFVYIVEAGRSVIAAARFYPPPYCRTERPIRSFESRLSQNSDRIKGVPGHGYFAAMLPSVTYVP